MSYYPNDNAVQCSVCEHIYEFLYQVPGNWHQETAPGAVNAQPICVGCVVDHIEELHANQEPSQCPCCNEPLTLADFQEYLGDISSPEEHGIPPGTPMNAYALEPITSDVEEEEEEEEQADAQMDEEEHEQQEHNAAAEGG